MFPKLHIFLQFARHFSRPDYKNLPSLFHTSVLRILGNRFPLLLTAANGSVLYTVALQLEDASDSHAACDSTTVYHARRVFLLPQSKQFTR
jgi:hypothetical protein